MDSYSRRIGLGKMLNQSKGEFECKLASLIYNRVKIYRKKAGRFDLVSNNHVGYSIYSFDGFHGNLYCLNNSKDLLQRIAGESIEFRSGTTQTPE